MSSTHGRILPQPDSAPLSDAAAAGFSERRAAVMAARAERCEQLGRELLALAPEARRRPFRVLEIGSGHGHFLEAYADAHPDRFCLGIDYCAERSRRAARKQQRHVHGGLFFLRAEVWEFFDALPADFCFDAVFVLFPDPWPKRRHQKYRLISERFLSRLAASVYPEAALYLRTDAAAYFDEARQTIAEHPLWRLEPAAPWPFERPTVFQAKAPAYQSLVAFTASPATTSAAPARRSPQT